MDDAPKSECVMVTGATGFVGRSVVRSLVARGFRPICVVRSRDKLQVQHPDIDPRKWTAIVGDLGDEDALSRAAQLSHAVIHLVGIILERRLRGQTFRRVHVRGTQAIVRAARQAGIRRFVHMSALGTRADAASAYHKTKWAAEQLVRASGLDWTILRPSLIHGPQGEFMRLVSRLVCGMSVPVIPCFGDGLARVQPVSVEDVAYCCVESLRRDKTAGKVIPLGGPEAYSWVELYNVCRALMPRAARWKPVVSVPVAVARLIAMLSSPPMALMECIVPRAGLFRLGSDQIRMSQEDNVCDHTIAEHAFGIAMRSFEDELPVYADLIG